MPIAAASLPTTHLIRALYALLVPPPPQPPMTPGWQLQETPRRRALQFRGAAVAAARALCRAPPLPLLHGLGGAGQVVRPGLGAMHMGGRDRARAQKARQPAPAPRAVGAAALSAAPRERRGGAHGSRRAPRCRRRPAAAGRHARMGAAQRGAAAPSPSGCAQLAARALGGCGGQPDCRRTGPGQDRCGYLLPRRAAQRASRHIARAAGGAGGEPGRVGGRARVLGAQGRQCGDIQRLRGGAQLHP